MAKTEISLLSRFQGCLVGLGVGDSLGAPVEGMSSAAIRRRFGQVTDMLGGGRLILRPGRYTDDTAMMLCIARSIVEKGFFDAGDVAAKFLEWFDGDPVGIGRTAWLALSEMKRGASWLEASENAHRVLGGLSAGNGSIMRCAPIGLLDFRHPVRLTSDSVESSMITHWDPRARWGAAALNLAISCILLGQKDKMMEAVREKVEQPDVVRAVCEVERWQSIQFEPSAYVLDTLQAALWCYLKTSSFEQALVTAVNLGGDTDTVGAVCGALAGVEYGLEAIPRRWRDLLQDGEEIKGLAGEIYGLAVQS